MSKNQHPVAPETPKRVMARCPECEDVFPATDLNYEESSGHDVCDDCLTDIQDRQEEND